MESDGSDGSDRSDLSDGGRLKGYQKRTFQARVAAQTM